VKPSLAVMFGQMPHGEAEHEKPESDEDHGEAILAAIKEGSPGALKAALKECILEVLAEEHDKEAGAEEEEEQEGSKPSLSKLHGY
jgi:hypothetical protein